MVTLAWKKISRIINRCLLFISVTIAPFLAAHYCMIVQTWAWGIARRHTYVFAPDRNRKCLKLFGSILMRGYASSSLHPTARAVFVPTYKNCTKGRYVSWGIILTHSTKMYRSSFEAKQPGRASCHATAAWESLSKENARDSSFIFQVNRCVL